MFIFCLFMLSIQFFSISMSEILNIFKITNIWTEDRQNLYKTMLQPQNDPLIFIHQPSTNCIVLVLCMYCIIIYLLLLLNSTSCLFVLISIYVSFSLVYFELKTFLFGNKPLLFYKLICFPRTQIKTHLYIFDGKSMGEIKIQAAYSHIFFF